jgi:hypothetical protein
VHITIHRCNQKENHLLPKKSKTQIIGGTCISCHANDESKENAQNSCCSDRTQNLEILFHYFHIQSGTYCHVQVTNGTQFLNFCIEAPKLFSLKEKNS